jgi:Zn ribbon nucleic-acid-binding protein
MMRAQQTWSTPAKEEQNRHIPCALCGGRQFKRAFDCEGFGYVRCVKCGLVQINPQPEPTAVHSRYNESYLSYELKNESSFFNLGKLALKDAKIEEIERKTFPCGEKRALEVGCATGALLEYLKNRGWNVQGVEISEVKKCGFVV